MPWCDSIRDCEAASDHAQGGEGSGELTERVQAHSFILEGAKNSPFKNGPGRQEKIAVSRAAPVALP
jgi:hypothetical protein